MCLGLQRAPFPMASRPVRQICSRKQSSCFCHLQPGCLYMVWSTPSENGRGRWILGLCWPHWGPQCPLTFRPKDTQTQARYWATKRSCWRIQTYQLQPPCLFAGPQGLSPSPFGGIQHSTLSGQVTCGNGMVGEGALSLLERVPPIPYHRTPRILFVYLLPRWNG